MTTLRVNDAAKIIYAHLSHIPISQVLNHAHGSKKPLISVHQDTTLDNVLSIMHTSQILAIPVYKVPKDEPDGKVFTGIVSVFDILANTVFQSVFDDMSGNVKNPITMSKDEFQQYIRMVKEEHAYFSTKIGELLGQTSESAESWTLHSSDPLTSLLQILTYANRHRALIIDDDVNLATVAPPSGSSIRLVTQTDLLRYLLDTDCVVSTLNNDTSDCKESLQSALDTIWSIPVSNADRITLIQSADPQTLSSTQLSETKKQLVCVESSMSALAALRSLYLHQVSAVAVVDTNGRLVANLSASDLRGVNFSNLEMLLGSVFEFLEAEKRTPNQLKSDQLKSVEPGSVVGEVGVSMMEHMIHHLWVVDDDDHPIGVVSMSDVLALFVPENGAAVEQ